MVCACGLQGIYGAVLQRERKEERLPSRRVVASPVVALATALCALILLVGCGGGDGGGGATTLNWFVQIQPGGSFQEVAKRCSEESNGRYQIDLELLPTDASQAREQLVRRLGAEDSTIDVIGMDVVWTGEFANAGGCGS